MKKIFNFLKIHWFKLGVLFLLFLITISVIYSFLIITSQKTNSVLDSEKQIQQTNNLSKLPPPPIGQKGYTLDELKTLTSNTQEPNSISPQLHKNFVDWIHKSNTIKTQLFTIIKNIRGVDLNINYTDILNSYKSQIEQLSIQMSDLTTPDVPFVEKLVENKNLISHLSDDVSILCLDKKSILDAQKASNFDLASLMQDTYTTDLNKITQDINNITDNLNYITAYEIKYGIILP